MRTFGVKTSFISSPAFEKERMLYLATSLAEGFYGRHGFIFVPKINPKFGRSCVVVPEVLSKASLRFWEEAKKGGQTMPKRLTEAMRREFAEVELPAVEAGVVKKIEKEWRKIEKDFWQFVEDLFLIEKGWVGSVEVRVSKIGSLGSHYLLGRSKGQKLVINIREDGKAADIAGLIILALIWPLKDKLNLTWSGRMAVRDFVMSRVEMKKLFWDWKRIGFENGRIPEELRRESDEYLNFLRVPKPVDPAEAIEKNWSVFGNRELKFLRLLIKNRGELVSYDQIADEVWGAGEFKTYWAINKIYQRTQKKMDSLGVVLKIKGFRGRGYKLG